MGESTPTKSRMLQELRNMGERVGTITQNTLVPIGVATLIMVSAIMFVNYVNETYAKIKYVDEKFDEAIKHSDENAKKNRELLEEIQKTMRVVDQRTWELNGRQGPRPASVEQ
jgi:hypothetical protein